LINAVILRSLLARLWRLDKPSQRVKYEFEERTRPGFGEILERFTESIEKQRQREIG